MDSGFTFPADLIDSNFAEKEAKWAKAAERYDNLSKLPPKQTNNYYVKNNKQGPKCVKPVHTYLDPWPVNKKKKEAPPQDKHITAGVAADDREEFDQELIDFARKYNPDGSMDISEVIAAKNRRIAEVQKAMLSGQGPAAARAQNLTAPTQSLQPTPANPHNTRSRKAQNATEGANVAKAATANGDTENPEGSTPAPGVADVSSLRDTPPIMQHVMMRSTRKLSADHTSLSRPLRGVVSDSYYTSNAQASRSQPASAGDEPEEASPAADQQDASPEDEQTSEKPIGNMQKEDHTADSNKLAQGYLSKADGKRKVTSTANAPKITDEPKLRRALKACDNCRKHKTRCNGGNPCEACERRKFTCIYAPGERKTPGKRPQKPKSDSDNNDDADNDARPAKRARKGKGAPAVKTEESTKAKQPAKSIKGEAPHAKRARKDSEQVETKPAQPSQPAPSQRTTRGRGKRSRDEAEVIETQSAKRQRSSPEQTQGVNEQTDEVEAGPSGSAHQDQPNQTQPNQTQPTQTQPAKPQSSEQGRGKRALEDNKDIEARPAKQQRKDPYIPWHILHSVVDNAVLEEEDGTFKAFSLGGQDFTTKEEYINWMEQEDAFHNRPSIKLVMPDLLKAILVDDWEHVTKDQQLVPIPHEHPVDEVLKEYLDDEKFKREEGSTQMDILHETIAGLREYFDRTLGRILLYR